ncbi:MAG: DNA repair protein RecN [Deltaproteobacteria bacterium]|nr:DNA repair protein RecN [Deltaproteobacteria bacterium]
MLLQLTISNFAIIKHLEIDFQPGLNIISGETGAGKSIIINAVNLILGGRATADLIRTGADEARVEAYFSLPASHTLEKFMRETGLPFNGELLIRRIISKEGRNRIIINDSIATLQVLSKIGTVIISISGQHEHQIMLRPENHLFLLDDFGGLIDERLMLMERFHEYDALKEKRRRMERDIRNGMEKQELVRFQIQEIESANIIDGEDSLLEEERKRLRYAEQLKEMINGSYQNIYESEDSVLSRIALSIKEMEKGSAMDSRLETVRRSLERAGAELEDAGLELRDLMASTINDPGRLEEVEERLYLINKLKRKYGASLGDVISFREGLVETVENLGRMSAELDAVKAEINKIEADLADMASALSKKRKAVAGKFEQAVEAELKKLDMAGTRFAVRFKGPDTIAGEPSDGFIDHVSPEGIDEVEFVLSPNVGEELKPLARIASGGELSRIMLALKSILARKMSVETVIFDEVDSGISGATAEVVGEKLKLLAEYHQILCITHLPQIASKGETHFAVKKTVKENRTLTDIIRLDPEERVKEIARLLGGKVVSEQAVRHAREMLSS